MTAGAQEMPAASKVTMTALQRAYSVGRMPEFPLGGVECLAYFEFRGRAFNAARLQSAVERVHRHAALRSRFVLDDEAILEDGDADAPRVTIRDASTDPNRVREEIRNELMHDTIDIGRGINWSIALSATNHNDHVLHLVFSLAAIPVRIAEAIFELFIQNLAQQSHSLHEAKEIKLWLRQTDSTVRT